MAAVSNETVRSNLLRESTLLTIAALLAVAVVAAQTHPNFSGRWVLVSETSPQELPLAHRLTVEQTDTHPLPMLTVRRDDSERIERYQIGIVGGVVGGDRQSTSRSWHSVVWREARLVIALEESHDSSRAYSSETWELDREGHLVLTRTERHEPDSTPPRTTVGTYRRE